MTVPSKKEKLSQKSKGSFPIADPFRRDHRDASGEVFLFF